VVEETREEEGKKTESVGGGGGSDAEGVLDRQPFIKEDEEEGGYPKITELGLPFNQAWLIQKKLCLLCA
jgi:hypothetical protein